MNFNPLLIVAWGAVVIIWMSSYHKQTINRINEQFSIQEYNHQLLLNAVTSCPSLIKEKEAE